jgi:glycosyltransferase involved in cell wall biosynthesis
VAGVRGHGSGLSRYVEELVSRLAPVVDLRVVRQRSLPLAARLVSPLAHLPIALDRPVGGSVVHFTRLMGAAQMLWYPARPAVATVHDLGPLVLPEDEPMWNRLDRQIFRLQLRGLRKMDWWVVNSQQTRHHLIDRLDIPDDRISWVQLGVDAQRFSFRPDAAGVLARELALRKIPGVLDILYVGNEQPRKGLGYLLDGLAHLRDAGHRVRLLKAGAPGGDRWRFDFERRVARLGLEPDVSILGHVSDDLLPCLYSFADICATPTLLEGGFTWTAMEAMACSRPVVATTAALIRPEAARAALIVPPRDSRALAGAIARFIDDATLRTRRGVQGREAIQQFSWDATVNALTDVYVEVWARHLHRLGHSEQAGRTWSRT